jgi:16S rRNA (guanine527-N7)-methyltransferase
MYGTMTDGELLREGLRRLDFADSAHNESCAQSLEIYLHELELFNKMHSFTAETGRSEIIIRHIFDSLAALHAIRSLAIRTGSGSPVIADIGSGGGFPGIPLAVCMRDIRFVLIERMQKRSVFLESCTAIMGLSNVTVENTPAEQLRQQFDVCVFRSFHPLDKSTLPVLLKLAIPTGFLAAYKAKIAKIHEEMDAVASLVSGWTAEKLDVPFLHDHERHLVIIPACARQ